MLMRLNNKKGCHNRMTDFLLCLLLLVTTIAVSEGKEGELRGLNRKPLSTTISSSEETNKRRPRDIFSDDSQDDGNLQEEQEEQETIDMFAAPPSDVIRNFKTRLSLKDSEDLPMQQISSSNTVMANGRAYSLDGLVPVDIFTADATYSEDGEAANLPTTPSTFTKRDGDTTMLVTEGGTEEDEMRTIELVHNDGTVTSMEEVTHGVVATVLAGARDRDLLNKFVMAHLDVADDDRGDDGADGSSIHDGGKIDLGGSRTSKLFNTETLEDNGGGNRKLQSQCPSFRVLEIAVAYESSFCSQMRGAANANAVVQQIVSRASALYQANFCTKIRISHMEGFCNANADPYRAAVLQNNSGCSGGGLLGSFANFWNRNRGYVRRDVAHLFSGTGLECTFGSCVIGCARTQSLCSPASSYAVNFITFNRDRQLQSILFAHELGHNAGANHDATTPRFEFIMESRINGGANGFSRQSRAAIGNYLGSRSCVSTERASPDFSRPTNPAPTPSFSTRPAPTSRSGESCGCSTCTASVLAQVANGYRCIDRINWVIRFQGKSELDACAFISDAYPSICGQGCDPKRCNNVDDNGAVGSIRSRQDSHCMDLNTATGNVHSSSCTGRADQNWNFDSSNQHIVSAVNNNFCLQWNLANNNLEVSSCNSGNNQKWVMSGNSIKSQQNQDACIDLNPNDGNYYMHGCHGAANQQFAVPNGFF